MPLRTLICAVGRSRRSAKVSSITCSATDSALPPLAGTFATLIPRGAARHEFGGMGNEALKPGQHVVEFRSRLRIPVGEVDGSDQDSLNSRFDVAGLVIFRIPRQACAGQHGSVVSRENGTPFRNAPLPDCFVPESSKGIQGKAPCSALSSWRLTTSGSALANQAKRLSSRLLMLLTLKVATLTKSPSAPGHLDVRCTSWYYFNEIVMEAPWNLQSRSRVRRRSRRLFANICG